MVIYILFEQKDESKLDELISLKHTLNGLRGGLRLLGNTRIKLINSSIHYSSRAYNDQAEKDRGSQSIPSAHLSFIK